MKNRPSRQRGRERRPWFSSPLVWSAAVLGLLALFACNHFPSDAGAELNYGELIQLLNDAQVQFQDVEVTPSVIQGTYVRPDGGAVRFVTNRGGLENDPGLVPLLRQKVGAGLKGRSADNRLRRYVETVLQPLAVIFFGVCFFSVVRLIRERSPAGFNRSRARAVPPAAWDHSFRDVAGIDEAVEELREIVDFLKNPARYQALGGRIPKGVLLVGPPGTGKTLLAKAVAGEARVPFFSISGSDFVEMYVGVGAARVRDLFAGAVKQAPCIIFIDELDALGKSRGPRTGGGHDEREQTLNQLLVEMDGFDSNRGVILMAATNRPETLDAALLRPGRFDRTVVVDRPDIVGREAILRVHAQQVKLGAELDLRAVAAMTPGFVGADLANLMNEAALLAARRGRSEVSFADLEEAVERGVAGLERRRVMPPREKERIAYHECGHALVAYALPDTDPIHKVSIIPRGAGALGYTLQRPDDDRVLHTRSELVRQIQILLGGTVAEELVYGEISTGAQSDLDRASRIARGMVTQFGMSRLGRVSYAAADGAPFLPGTGGERTWSERTAYAIDQEVRRILDEAAEEVRLLLSRRRPALEATTRALLDKEVLSGAEFQDIARQHLPGLHLVPGSDAVDPRPPARERGENRPACEGSRRLRGSWQRD